MKLFILLYYNFVSQQTPAPSEPRPWIRISSHRAPGIVFHDGWRIFCNYKIMIILATICVRQIRRKTMLHGGAYKKTIDKILKLLELTKESIYIIIIGFERFPPPHPRSPEMKFVQCTINLARQKCDEINGYGLDSGGT